jgi:hypothetical protein
MDKTTFDKVTWKLFRKGVDSVLHTMAQLVSTSDLAYT